MKISSVRENIASSRICQAARNFTPPVVTTVKVQKVALYALATAVLVGGGFTAKAVLAGRFAVKAAFSTQLSITAMLAAVAASLKLVSIAKKMRDYQDPKELAKMQEEAKDLSFLQLIALHGFKNIDKVIDRESLSAKCQDGSKQGPLSIILTSIRPEDLEAFSALLSKEQLRASFIEEVKQSSDLAFLTPKYAKLVAAFDFLTQEELGLVHEIADKKEQSDGTHHDLVKKALRYTGNKVALQQEQVDKAAFPYVKEIQDLKDRLVSALTVGVEQPSGGTVAASEKPSKTQQLVAATHYVVDFVKRPFVAKA